ncbi:MAG: nucleoside deaminase [Cyclobacteriaceae bacterium]
MLSVQSHDYFMKKALHEAEEAYQKGEIPVGAVVVSDGKIIARAHNQVERLQDATAHAEMLAITSAQNHLGSKYLEDCSLYVTLEPCTMCAGALFWSQVGEVIIAARDETRGFSRLQPSVLHPKTNVVHGILENEASTLISAFFSEVRAKQKRKQ